MDPRREPPRLHMAPLHGVTNSVFRRAWFRHFAGFDSILAPFVLSVHVEGMKEKHFKDFLPDPEVGLPLVPQILGSDAEAFVATARILGDLGYTEVNWNLGCPYPMVARKGRGSGLLPHPDRIARFLDEVCPRLAISLSVKLRLGHEDPAEILPIMPILDTHPLSCVIIHPRIGTQMYKGLVDLEGFARAASISRQRIVYNGDIREVDGYEALRVRFPGVGDWMIGRGAISNPFLPALIKGLPPPPEPLKALRAFHDELYHGYREVLFGPGHVLDKMKEVWTYLGLQIGGVETAFHDLARTKTILAYEAAVRAVFADAFWKRSPADWVG